MKITRRKGMRLFAGVLAAALLTSQTVMAEAIPPELTESVKAALMLTETDLEANSDSVRLLLQTCVDDLDETDPVCVTLKSILFLIDSGNADAASVAVLLKTLLDEQGESPQAAEEESAEEEPTAEEPPVEEPAAEEPEAEEPPVEEPAAEEPEAEELEAEEPPAEEPAAEEPAAEEPAAEEPAEEKTERESRTGLPVFPVSDYIRRIIRECVLVNVPGDWGNNDEAGRALTSYSPINDSGAISPSAGTLSLSYFPADGEDEETAFETYEENIARMSVTTDVSSKDAHAAGLNAKTVEYIMNVGANQFICETICFAYDDMIYSIELMQGPMSEYDFFPVYQKVVDSAQIGSPEEVEEVEREEEERSREEPEEKPVEVPAEEPEPEPEKEPEEEPEEQQEPDTLPVEPDPETDGIESFQYLLNGHRYQFPTVVGSMGTDLPLDFSATLPYNMFPEKAVQKGKYAEIINTEYFVLPSPFFKEMAAVTNMSGHEVPMTDGILTVLIDTGGDAVNMELPCGLRVGSPEADILKGFPAFAELSMDGVAGFVGNEFIYACNVRADGCTGYVIIRNDAPYYSSVSIICEDQVIQEITFECLGSVRAAGIFL